jgi:hypothetical protein
MLTTDEVNLLKHARQQCRDQRRDKHMDSTNQDRSSWLMPNIFEYPLKLGTDYFVGILMIAVHLLLHSRNKGDES